MMTERNKKVRAFLGEGPSKERLDNVLLLPWWLRILLVCVGGCLVFLSFPTFDFYYFAYFALVFHLWAIHGLSPRRAFWLGLLGGSITNVGGFYWISGLLVDFGHMSLWLATLLCVLLCITQGFVYAFWAYLVRKIDISPYKSGIAAFLAMEFIIPMLFPWYYGNSQYLFIPATQIAEIFGVFGVTLLLVVVNFLIYELSTILVAKRRGIAFKVPKRFFAMGSAFVVFCFVFGVIRIQQIDKIQEEAPKLHVGMVEADIGIWEKEDEKKLRNNLFIHHALSKQLVDKGVELIVWPESSYQSHYIWGSALPSNDLVELEADALYTENFAPKAALIMRGIDAAFGPKLRVHGEFSGTYHRALMRAGIATERHAALGSYPLVCKPHPKSMLKCPFTRVVPDAINYYLPSNAALLESRDADFKARTMPYNMEGVQRDIRTPIIFGTLTMEGKPELELDYHELLKASRDALKVYNTATFLDADGRVLGKYHKVYLLLFGEYIPLVDKIPWIYDILPEAGNLSPGQTTDIIEFNGARFAIIICYEDILPRFVRTFSRERPQVFINITNDAWFGKTTEPYLHMALATMRSVEHRKWLVRSTNTGVSVFVDAVGRIVAQTSLYDAETLDAMVSIMPPTRSVYSYIGDVLAWLSLLATAFFFFTIRKRRAKKQK
ncbi:MAG: apolipoprotein N-acyltransferase [Bradymonadales bacterium]|jgi:apolipoprotein N-acyltransferase